MKKGEGVTIRRMENVVSSIFIICSIRRDLLLRIQDQEENNSMLKKRVLCRAGEAKRDELWFFRAKWMYVAP
jgi:hypothetical protein